LYIFIFCSKKKISSIFSDWILFRNCLFRLDPLEELSSETIPFTGSAFFQTRSFAGTVLRNHILCRNCLWQTLSFAGTVVADRILYRNCRCRPYPLQELPLQIKFFTHRNCLFTLQPLNKLILGNHNLSGKASLQLATIFFRTTLLKPSKHTAQIPFRNFF